MRSVVRYIAFVLSTMIVVPPAFSHCDTLSGPVIADARLAFKQAQVTPVLKWVRSSDEATIREAFGRALAVRAKGDQARELAERYFFETLVRLHRASEGEPYTGLKAVSPDSVITSVDSALQSGNSESLIQETLGKIRSELKARLDRVEIARKNAESSVEAGRDYVRAYVDLMHFVEQLHGSAAAEAQPETSAHAH